jgi:asparagine synthase (glutamine-hydrolysing)
LVAAFAAQESDEQITTFSIGFNEEKYSELSFARRVAERYDTRHFEHIVTPDTVAILPEIVRHYEEPFADPSALPTWYLAQETKKEITVALNGDGGDEAFAGYERFLVPRLSRILSLVPGKSLGAATLKTLSAIGITHDRLRQAQRLLGVYNPSELKFYLNVVQQAGEQDVQSLYTSELRALVDADSSIDHVEDAYNNSDVAGGVDALLYTALHTFLPDDLLVKVDIASMAHGVEVRSPFLDHDLLEFTARMPDQLKIRGGSKKDILKRIARKHIPKECLDRSQHGFRTKQGFIVPLNEWFRGELQEYVRQTLLDDKFIGYGFNARAIERILAQHMSGKRNHEKQIWSLLMLRLWLREWFEEGG